MSELHIRQIRSALKTRFQDHIDLSDITTSAAEDRANQFLSRALAAFSLSYLAQVPDEISAHSVTDGFKDNGIDAVYYHPSERVLYLVQSKWRNDGSKTVSRGEIQKFIKGFRDFINARWDRFNSSIQTRSADLESALNDAQTRVVLIVAYTGINSLSPDVDQDLADVLDEVNDPVQIVSRRVFRQSDVYSAVQQGLKAAPIDIEVQLYDWGQVREPYTAYYGQVSASDLATWYSDHQALLFTPNIRVFLGQTLVNDSIVNTVQNDPSDFWYFNNGVTVLCAKIDKKPIGGASRETGIFECSDLRIVNGAQTVGALAQAADNDYEQAARARVPIRIISLEGCPEGFEKLVTRFNNTQNRIDRRDFVALDVEQERIRGECQLEGIDYVYKSGDVLINKDKAFDLTEATVALACARDDVSFAVQAKREIGRLWDDIEKAPYKILFNADVNGPRVWRLVQVSRVVEHELGKMRNSTSGRERLLAVHGNRLIAHVVYQRTAEQILDIGVDWNTESEVKLTELTVTAYKDVLEAVNTTFPDSYLASLVKNQSKCEELASQILS